MNIELACFTAPQRGLNNLIKKNKLFETLKFKNYNVFSITRLLIYVQCEVFSSVVFSALICRVLL